MQKPSLLLEVGHFFYSAYPGAEQEPFGFLTPKFFHFAPKKPDDSSVRAGRDLVSHLPGCSQQPWVQVHGSCRH